MSVSFDRKTLLALLDASEAINSQLDVNEVFQRIAEHAAAVLQADGASVILYDSDRQELVFHTAVGPTAKDLIGTRFDAKLGIAGQTIKTGRPVRIDNARQNRNFFPGIDARTGAQTRSVMAAPLSRHDQILGVVEVINPIGRDCFNDRDLDLLGLFANLATAAASNAQAYDKVVKENQGLKATTTDPQVIGQSSSFRQMQKLCQRVSTANVTVLLCGETGTGKEMAAKSIHTLSPRRDKPFVALNCAALPESLLESELFGHEKGAFTGAVEQRPGRFELADGGSLFLDEIGETGLSIQAKLLRVLQEREFVRVGGSQTITCNVRIIAATNRDLKQEIEAGRFREDLFYRLNVFPIRTPPLRERIEDIPLLVKHLIQQAAAEMGIKPPVITDEAMSSLMRYRWPGNIRELRNVVERCTLLAEGQITLETLPPEIALDTTSFSKSTPRTSLSAHASPSAHDLSDHSHSVARENSEPTHGQTFSGSRLDEHERAIILQALAEANWNQSQAARDLKITRDHLRYRIKKYKIKQP